MHSEKTQSTIFTDATDAAPLTFIAPPLLSSLPSFSTPPFLNVMPLTVKFSPETSSNLNVESPSMTVCDFPPEDLSVTPCAETESVEASV